MRLFPINFVRRRRHVKNRSAWRTSASNELVELRRLSAAGAIFLRAQAPVRPSPLVRAEKRAPARGVRGPRGGVDYFFTLPRLREQHGGGRVGQRVDALREPGLDLGEV